MMSGSKLWPFRLLVAEEAPFCNVHSFLHFELHSSSPLTFSRSACSSFACPSPFLYICTDHYGLLQKYVTTHHLRRMEGGKEESIVYYLSHWVGPSTTSCVLLANEQKLATFLITLTRSHKNQPRDLFQFVGGVFVYIRR